MGFLITFFENYATLQGHVSEEIMFFSCLALGGEMRNTVTDSFLYNVRSSLDFSKNNKRSFL